MRSTWYVAVGVGVTMAALAVGCNTNELGHLAAKSFGDVSNGDAPRTRFDRELVAACGAPSTGESDASRIARTPYLQRTTHASTDIVWTTTDPSAHTVALVTPAGATVARISSATMRTKALASAEQRIVRFTDLEPSSIYCYALLDRAGAHVLGPFGFRTAPAPASGEQVAFATMGDLGSRTTDQFAVLEQLRGVAMDFVLINGDVAYDDGTLREFERHFFDVYAHVLRHVPFFVASGNHDYRTDNGAVFREVFALFENSGAHGRERWFSFDWGPVHVAVLDTEYALDEQIKWLDADLAATTAPWKILTMHRPAYSSGKHGSDMTVRRAIAPIARKHRVQLVFAGHDHHYERSIDVDGTHYVVAGAGGRGTRAVGESSFTAHAERVSHFVYVTANADTLTLWAIDATGVAFDSLRLNR